MIIRLRKAPSRPLARTQNRQARPGTGRHPNRNSQSCSRYQSQYSLARACTHRTRIRRGTTIDISVRQLAIHEPNLTPFARDHVRGEACTVADGNRPELVCAEPKCLLHGIRNSRGNANLLHELVSHAGHPRTRSKYLIRDASGTAGSGHARCISRSALEFVT